MLLLMAIVLGSSAPAAAQVTFHVTTTQDSVDINPGDGVALDANGETSLRAAVMETNALIAAGNQGPYEIVLSLNPVPGAQVEYIVDIPADLAAPGYDADSAAWDDLDLNGPPAGQPPVQVTIQGIGVVFQDPSTTPGFPLQCWHGTPPNPATRPVAVVRWPDPPPPPLPDERDRIFDARNVVLTIREVELVNGRASSAGAASGGAIRAVDADVELRDSILRNHSAGTRGGAIDLHSLATPTTLIVERTRICACGAQENGGAIAVDGVAPELHVIDDSTIQANQSNGLGGGVYLGTGNGFISSSTISENVGYVGGGAYLRGATDIDGSLISGNSAVEAVPPPDGPLGATAGGGIYVDGIVNMIDSNVQLNIADRGSLDDRGGGVAVSANGTLHAERCSFLDNEAGFPFLGTGWGGGLYSIGAVTLTNVTISGNHAGLLGGGAYIDNGTADLSHATIAWNRLWQFAPAVGSGLAVASGTVNVRSTLIGDNEVKDPSQPPIVWISGGNCAFNVMLGPNTDYNLDSDGTCVGGAFPPNGFGANSIVAPTGINVSRTPCGVTEVHELLPGSPAIDQADPGCLDVAGIPVVDDQCGNARVSPCDIGAFEAQSQPGPCAPGAINEPESCGSDTNGGCNSTPPVYTFIACGDVVCGTAWAEAGVRDTDWYSVNLADADGDGLAELTADLSADLPLVLLILNDQCSNIQVLASTEANVGAPGSVTACLAAPATYRVFVATGSLAGGIFNNHPCGTGNDYTLTLNCQEPCTNPPPANDDCTSPTVIGAGVTSFDNLNATTDGPPDCGFFLGDVPNNSDADVWYEFIAPCDGLASFTFEPQYDHLHAIYPQSPCVQPGVAPIICNHLPAGASHTFTLAVVSGQSYIIRIGGDQGQTGDGLLTIACPCDHFDGYNPLIELPAQSAWEPWNGDPAAANFFASTAQSLSAPHALEIDGNDDAVHRYYDRTTGRWTYTAWTYVPQGMSSTQYFILLNAYPAVNVHDWSLQVELNGGANTVEDFDSPASLPMIKGQWTELRVEIDLNNDQQSVYYDNQLLVTKSWTAGVNPGGALNIAAVNLWANGSTDEVYYDDLCLEDSCSCQWDLNGDCVVNVLDLMIALSQWGQPYTVAHVLQLLAQWGPCP